MNRASISSAEQPLDSPNSYRQQDASQRDSMYYHNSTASYGDSGKEPFKTDLHNNTMLNPFSNDAALTYQIQPLKPTQRLTVKNSLGPSPAQPSQAPPVAPRIRRKPLARVPVHREEHDEDLHQVLTPINSSITPLQPGSTTFNLNYETSQPSQPPQPQLQPQPQPQQPPHPSSQPPVPLLPNHQQSTSKGSLTSNSLSSSPTKSTSSLYTVPSNTTTSPPSIVAASSGKLIGNPQVYQAAAPVSLTRTPSPGQQIPYYYGQSPGFPQHLTELPNHSFTGSPAHPDQIHAQHKSGSSFDFSIEKPLNPTPQQNHQILPSNGGINLTNYEEPNGYPNNITPNNFNANQTSGMNSNAQLSRVTTAASQPSYHHRNSSVNSATSSKSQQPLYMAPIPQGLKISVSSASSINSQKQLNAAQKRLSMSSNTGGTGANSSTSFHNRLPSTSSRVSRGSSEFQHSNVSGSFYVHELRRRAATTWCDIPASVWGVPIGIAESTGRKSSTLSQSQLAGQRRTMDIRHSHLTPRLLASEADDSDFDAASINTAIEAMGSNNVSRRASTTGLKIPHVLSGIGESDAVSIRSTATLSSPRLPTSTPLTYDQKSGVRSRSDSVSSVKSIEEGTQKIRLFVANPDSDSD